MRTPRAHQIEGLLRAKGLAYFGFIWDPRCGKTYEVNALAVANYRRPPFNIDAMLVVSWPAGVHRIWIEDEIPKDLPPAVNPRGLVWRSGRMETKTAKQELIELLAWPGLAVLSLNCEALLTPTCWAYVQKFLAARRALVNGDEISFMASPSAARTKRMLAIGRHPGAVMRLFTDGGIVDESPLNLWAPSAFLGGAGPHPLGFRTFYAFKARYAKLETGHAPGGRSFEKVTGYKNLEELSEKLSRFTHRVRREDVSDAPPKVYQKRLFQLSPAQRQVYDRLRDEYVAELADRQLTVTHVLDRLTKLSMVARGYFPPVTYSEPCAACAGRGCLECDALGVRVDRLPLTRIDPEGNPARRAFELELAGCRGPVVVWNRFRLDVDDSLAALAATGRRVGRYDGTVPAAEREATYLAFKAGQLDAVAATVGSGISRGHDLSRALDLIYYSDGYSLRGRRQTEDRAEGIGRTASTGIVDLIAEDTVDVARVAAQRAKRSVAELVMGDEITKWI